MKPHDRVNPPPPPHTVQPFPAVAGRVGLPRRPAAAGSRRGRVGRVTRSAPAQPVALHPEPKPPSVWYVYWLWVIILLDPHRFMTAHGFGFMGRLGTASFLPAAAMIALAAPGFLDSRRSWTWNAPFAAFIISGFFAVPLTLDRGATVDVLKPLIMYYMLSLVTCMTIKTVRQAIPIVVLFFLGQFLWWHLHLGPIRGFVSWHPLLSNVDGYGPLMVMGAPLAFYFGMALPRQTKTLRWFCAGVAAGCVVGIAASFARGAFVGAVSVAGMVLLRSPHRARTLAGLAAGAVVLVIAANIMFPAGAFWNEMATIVTEGKEGGTGQDRWVLWGMAIRVFAEHPVFGVGLSNFGQFAALFFDVGSDEAGHYGVNPGQLVGRSLHSMYFQILSEMGIVGSLAFLWMVVDFVKRNRALHSADAVNRWNTATGGRYDLRVLAYGLEAGAVGCLVTALFYAAYVYVHWVFTLFIMNLLLHGLVGGREGLAFSSGRRGPRPAGRGRAAAPV